MNFIFNVFLNILSAITGQLGPSYDPLFYDVVLYIWGIIFLIVIIIIVIVIIKRKKRKRPTFHDTSFKKHTDSDENLD